MKAESLSGMDSVFVTLDAANAPLHIGIVLELEPNDATTRDPQVRFSEIKATIEKRLGNLSVLRRRVIRVPFDLGPPQLVDDPDFDISFHVVRRAVPSPGDAKQVEALIGRIMARSLSPDRPLWEISVIVGREQGRTAILMKIHHALADGVSGVAVFAELFDLDPTSPREAKDAKAHVAAPIPSQVELLARSSSELLRRPAAALEALGSTLERMADRVDELVKDLASSTPSLLAAPRTSLSGTVSYARNFERFKLDLQQVKEVARSHGGTVTDFAMTIVGGALRRLLEERGETPDADLVAFMPVNIRAPGTEGELGNRISARLVPMASQTRDPFDRLDMLVANGKALSKTEDADSDFLNEVADAAGPTVASMAGRLIDAFDLFDHLPPVANVVVSSIPGPPVPLWCAGQKIVRATPLGPLMLNQSLNITLLSYIDTLEFGILACAKKVPDATLLREFLIEEAQMLLAEGGSVAHATSA